MFRCKLVTLLVNEMVPGVRAEAEIFEAAYGEPRGREYWNAYLSEPVPVYSLANLLSVHLAQNVRQLESGRIAAILAFRDAAEAGELRFIGDTRPLFDIDYDKTNFDTLRKIKVHTHEAVEWLLSKPKQRHLVPESLRIFLQSGESLTRARARPITEKNAKRFVAEYIRRKKMAGRRPTQVGLEAYAKEENMHGGRAFLRAEFRKFPGVDLRRGRPRISSTKIAKT